GIGIEKGRLQDRGRESDLVGQRVVIGVHRLRRHVPQRAVDRLGETRQLELMLELAGAHRIAEQVAALHLERRVIDIFVGVADARLEGGQLGQRLLLGRLVHPGRGGDAVLIGAAEILDQLRHLLLGGRRIIFRDVD
ncbi:hypothetical protein QU39_00100, partial [Staphylococcus aureus]